MTNIIFIQSTQKNGIKNKYKYILGKTVCSTCGDYRRVRVLYEYVCYTCENALPKCQSASQIKMEENTHNRKIQKKIMNNPIPVVYNGYNTVKG